MLRKALLPSIIGLLAYGFWLSPDFKQIAAGVAVFLFGMLSLEQGFQSFTGGLLERLLRNSTDRLDKSLMFGVVATTLMQSSSLVSVITISFLSAGMIGLKAGLGIIFGANIGTTTGAWLVAGFGMKVKISAYAMPLLVFGVMLIFQKAKSLKGIGYILAGLGFLFLGIHFMKEGFESFKEAIDLAAYAVPGYRGLFLFTLLGVAATVIMQSSHATLVLIITALASGQITYDNALALAIGANIGTTITAILGSMSSNMRGKQLAAGHLIFNMVTGLIAIIFITPFMSIVDTTSAFVGIADDDYTLKLSVFHTLFNLVGVIVMTPMIGPLVRFLERVMPVKVPEFARPLYLNDAALEFGDTAVAAVRMETERLFDNAFRVLAHGLDLEPSEIRSDRGLERIVAGRDKLLEVDIDEVYEQDVKVLYGAIVEFISKAQLRVPNEHGELLLVYRDAARAIVEAVKGVKHLRKNLTTYFASENVHMRDAYADIRILLGRVMRDLSALQAEPDDRGAAAVEVLDSLRILVKSSDVLANGSLDALIRADKVTADMATSLINDSAYAGYAATHLINMAEHLFESQDPQEQEAARNVALTEDEIDILATSQPAPPRTLGAESEDQDPT
jgi:phosphate:Na+ symporter